MIGEVLNFIIDTPRGAIYAFLIVLLSLYYLFLKCRRDPRLVKFADTIPGPDGVPLLGSTPEFALAGLDGVGQIFTSYSQQYGSFYKYWIGNELVISLEDIEHLEVIFNSSKTLEKPENLFVGFKRFWNNSMFTCPVPVWRQTRKRLQPLFTKSVMRFQMCTLNESIDRMVNLVQYHLNGPEFDIHEYVPCTVADAFLTAYLNVHLSLKEINRFSFHKILNETTQEAFHQMINPWRKIDLIRKLFIGNKLEVYKETLREFFDFLKEKIIIQDTDVLKEKSPDKMAKSFFSVVQNLEKELKLENYTYEEVVATITASTDTTATIMSYCLLMIAMYPEIQSKLYEEIRDVFRSDEITIEDLDKCRYLDQVMKETLRRFNIVPNIFRYAAEDIKVGSMVIPAGVNIMIRLEGVNMNPDIYPNPMVFNPENFSPEAVHQRSKYSLLAFGAGIRDCPGKIFAESMIKLTMVAILRQFRLSSTTKMEDIEYVGGFIVVKSGGYWLSITPRDAHK